jgi:hypothetical protein
MTTRLILSSGASSVSEGAQLRVVPQHAVKARPGGEFLGPRHRQLVPQQRFRRHQDQRLAEAAVDLAAQDVEVIGRRRAVGHDPVVLAAHLQEPFEPGRGVFGALALEPVRQEAHEARHAQPFRFARADELVEHDLRAVGEIAELRLPEVSALGSASE